MAHILAVDDQQTIRTMIEAILTGAGHQVITANDGVEAMEQLRTHQFDMVITDINMPNMSGLSLIPKIRRLPAHQYVPILMLTTESSSYKKEKAKNSGASGWLTKPFDPTRLLTAVEKLIKK
ncbi:response regulator [Pseudoalteromonas piratica]|uniref:Fis family transcriptional regulator n=1 Tax=Pseudoalteromonas piratica TaxID=1348114 RepID=A0A0A7EGH4_9GAMM|nr:response regulator [Pseudoalteromonas piratica]AIY65729.1 Fis family transcriptional regulator [Pseudoalteromonas piratica]